MACCLSHVYCMFLSQDNEVHVFVMRRTWLSLARISHTQRFTGQYLGLYYKGQKNLWFVIRESNCDFYDWIFENLSKMMNWWAFCRSWYSLVYFLSCNIFCDHDVIVHWMYSYWEFAIFLCRIFVNTIKCVWYTNFFVGSGVNMSPWTQICEKETLFISIWW